MNFLDKFRQFMFGRYGMDQLGVGMAISYFVLSVSYNIFRFPPLMALAYVIFLLWVYRILSKNIGKRQQENIKFLSVWNPIKYRLESIGKKQTGSKNYRIYRCPSCKQMIRVPKGKGRISITCPKCRTEFIKKT